MPKRVCGSTSAFQDLIKCLIKLYDILTRFVITWLTTTRFSAINQQVVVGSGLGGRWFSMVTLEGKERQNDASHTFCTFYTLMIWWTHQKHLPWHWPHSRLWCLSWTKLQITDTLFNQLVKTNENVQSKIK